MKLGSVFDSLGGLPFDAKLDHVVRPGVQGARVNTGGWSTAPQFDLATLQAEAGKRRAFQIAFADRGLDVVALNGNGNPLHPTDPKQGQCLRDTIRTAGEMGIKKVCTMSGLPEGRSGGLMPNWGGVMLAPRNPNHPALSVERPAVPRQGQDRGTGQGVRRGPDRAGTAWQSGRLKCATASDTARRGGAGCGGRPLGRSAGPWHRSIPCPWQGYLADRAQTGRGWSDITLGFGHGEAWPRQFCYRLKMAGYDCWLSIEHDDVLLNPLEGLEKSVALLQGVLPKAHADFAPQAIWGPRSGPAHT